MQRPGAVVTAADRDPAGVQQLHHVVRVDAVERERDRSPAVHRLGRPEDPQSGNSLETLQRVRRDRVLVSGDRVHAERGHVPDRSAQPDGLRDRRGAGLEAVRGRGVGRPGHPDDLDHLAATEERRQGLEEVVTAPEHADARRAADLVTGERQHVAAQVGHRGRQLRDALRPVDHHHGADSVSHRRDLRDRVHRAQHVAHPGDRDDLGALVDQPVSRSRLEVETTLVGDVEPAQGRARTLARELPRHDVRVVLHDGDHDLVTGTELRRQRVRGEVERLGGVLREDDLFGTRGPDEGGHGPPRPLERGRRLRAQHVHGAGDVGVVLEVVGRDRVDDLTRLLARVAGVEVGQRVRADLAGQDREVPPYRLDVVAITHACAATFVYFS